MSDLGVDVGMGRKTSSFKAQIRSTNLDPFSSPKHLKPYNMEPSTGASICTF